MVRKSKEYGEPRLNKTSWGIIGRSGRAGGEFVATNPIKKGEPLPNVRWTQHPTKMAGGFTKITVKDLVGNRA